jgi:hypothetical protein
MRLIGTACRVQHLVSRAELNGKQCTVEAFDEARARYAARIGSENMWIKTENLVQILPDSLAFAAEGGKDEAVREWLTGGGDVDAVWFNPEINAHGNTMLMLACTKAHEHLVKLLLVHGAKVNHVNDGGVDALQHAAISMSVGWDRCFKRLVNANADVDHVSAAGGSARFCIELKLGIGKSTPPIVHGTHALKAQEMLRLLDRAKKQEERVLAEAASNAAAAALLAEEDSENARSPQRKAKRKGRRGKASQQEAVQCCAVPSSPQLHGKPTSVDEQSLCVVCMDEPKTHAFVPCGHVCVCQGCGDQLLAIQPLVCPMCRENATMVMKLYG